jgi:fatty acid amide hydrolase
MSVKDTFEMKGFSSTVGVTVKARNKDAEDGLFLDVLRSGGLIPFVKTNIPQIAMTYDSFNYIWGRANNPWDRTRTTGGSSGG